MNPYGDIVTSDETFEADFKSIREEEMKNNQKVKKVKKVKIPEFEMESETEEEIIESSSDEEPTSSIQPGRSNDLFPKSPVKVECYLRNAGKQCLLLSLKVIYWACGVQLSNLVIPQERKVLCI